MAKSMSWGPVREPCGFGLVGLLGMALAGCGGASVGPSDGTGGSAGTGNGEHPAAGSGASPTNGGAGPTNGGASPTNGGASPTNGGAGGAAGEAPSKRYSPDACKRAGGQPVPSKGGPQTPETDCESGVAFGIIDAASSGWDEGGLCCAVGKDPVLRACGARAGDPCSATEYCAYEPMQLCGAADAQSFCAPRPEQCVQLIAPVCGCNGETYDNSCYANAAGTGILKTGACLGLK